MDAGLDLMRLRQHKHPEWFRSDRICFIDTLLLRLWIKDYPDYLESLKDEKTGEEVAVTARRVPAGVYDYHVGGLPLFLKSGKVWGLEIDEIYTALHVGGCHWIALLIDLQKRHITVWDSILGPKTNAVVGEALEPVKVLFPFVRHVMAEEDDRWQYTLEPYTHTIVRGKNLPQNHVTGDCGVYCLKFIEFHSLGMGFPPKYLCDENMKVVRDRLAFDILHDLNRSGEEKRTGLENDLLDIYDGMTIK